MCMRVSMGETWCMWVSVSEFVRVCLWRANQPIESKKNLSQFKFQGWREKEKKIATYFFEIEIKKFGSEFIHRNIFLKFLTFSGFSESLICLIWQKLRLWQDWERIWLRWNTTRHGLLGPGPEVRLGACQCIRFPYLTLVYKSRDLYPGDPQFCCGDGKWKKKL